MEEGKLVFSAILAIAVIVLIILIAHVFTFSFSAQKNEFRCKCDVKGVGKISLLLKLNTSSKGTPEILQETIFNIVINNTSVPCVCRK